MHLFNFAGDDSVPGDGYVTNIHFSLTGVDGLPPDVSVFNYTKEWDFKVRSRNPCGV